MLGGKALGLMAGTLIWMPGAHRVRAGRTYPFLFTTFLVSLFPDPHILCAHFWTILFSILCMTLR